VSDRHRGPSDESGPPPETSGAPIWELYPVSDIRFVLVEIGKLSTQVQRLIADTGKHGDRIDEVRHQISFVKGALWVIGGLVVIFGAVATWYLKDKLGTK
jgi:hypothetical protein